MQMPLVLTNRRRRGGSASAPAFAPLDLFSTGSQGIWLDPSDLTTMFSDRAGTIPVTTPGTVVGKRLDKSGRGNHALAPTDAARPTYGVEPKGGRRNLLTWTEDFSSAFWTKSTSPALTLTNQGGGVWRLQAGAGSWYLVQPIAASGTHTMAIDVKSNGAGLDGFQIMMAGGFVGGNRTATSDWVRYSASGSVASSVTGICYNTSNAAIDLLIRFPQVELGSTATAYQRVTTAYDVTESGVPTTHYVQYDGSDDSMSTAAIDFTGTDKMSVFAGVRKLGTGSVGIIAETSSNSDGANGSFAIGAYSTEYLVQARGTSLGYYIPSGYTNPISNVLSGILDIAGTTLASEVIPRVNGVVNQAGAGGSAGTGNFGNHPLFIGRRANATLPFSGKDYGIVIVGKAASAGEITDTETWLAAKTSGVTI